MTEDLCHTLKIDQIVHRGGRGRDVEGGVQPQPEDMLHGITRRAAASVGALAEIGWIEVGKKAELTILDLNMPAMRPLIRVVANLVHDGHPGVVHSVMTDGEFLMRERRVLTVDEPALLAEAQAVTQTIGTRMLANNPDIGPPPGGLQWLDA
jgi:5-methylthioadenosine/S-adenosylhomocysteine deaminase